MNTNEYSAVIRDDGELLGYLSQVGAETWVPCTVFGLRLAAPTTHSDAEAYLQSHGLSYLAERWIYSKDGEQITVHIVEASPANVTVRFIDYGYPDLFGSTEILRPPLTGVLALA